MIVAFPASDRNIDAPIDPHFGRCSFFGFYNRDTRILQYKENKLRNAPEYAGIKVAEFLVKNGINKIYAIGIGSKTRKILNRLNIVTARLDSGTTIEQIINKLNY